MMWWKQSLLGRVLVKVGGFLLACAAGWVIASLVGLVVELVKIVWRLV